MGELEKGHTNSPRPRGTKRTIHLPEEKSQRHAKTEDFAQFIRAVSVV